MTQDWTLREAIEYYQRQGAPGDQGMLVALLREVQGERGGVLPAADVAEIAAAYGLKETFLAAVIKRYPGLRPQEAPTGWSCAAGPAVPAGTPPAWPPLWRNAMMCVPAASAQEAAFPTASPAA